jgi:Family of unknown function (DUF6364)
MYVKKRGVTVQTKLTLRLDDRLVKQAKKYAKQSGKVSIATGSGIRLTPACQTAVKLGGEPVRSELERGTEKV